MLFTTLTYVLFLVTAVGLAFALPQSWRVVFLALVSYFFYAYWKPAYALVIFALTAVNYVAALNIRFRGAWAVCLIVNLGTFFVFKYLGFFARELNEISAWLTGEAHFPVVSLLLPLGISFHTLQAIAYVSDVRRGVLPVERDFVRFALFISWFPQMIAGPIERGANLLRQLEVIRPPSREELRLAIYLLLWGYFKKFVVADNLATMVNDIYVAPPYYPAVEAWGAIYGFGLQLYFDFSAYMDIAMGSSLLFGIRLSENFRDPFLAASIPEFWRRWHITLSTWFFEYVYYPLVRRYPDWPLVAVMSVFALSGLWHGANWNFLLWGLLHGILYCATVFGPRWELPRALGIAITFNLVCLLWVLFRSFDLAQAKSLYLAAVGVTDANYTISLWPGRRAELLSVAVGLGTSAGFWWFRTRAVWAMVIVALLTLIFGEFDSQSFIYFQF